MQSASLFDSQVVDLSNAALGGSALQPTSPIRANEWRGGIQIPVAKEHRIANRFSWCPLQEHFVWGPASDSVLFATLFNFAIRIWNPPQHSLAPFREVGPDRSLRLRARWDDKARYSKIKQDKARYSKIKQDIARYSKINQDIVRGGP